MRKYPPFGAAGEHGLPAVVGRA